MTHGYVVFCDICGHGWDERDPGTRYRDGVWVCDSEPDCRERRAMMTLDAPPGTFGGDAA